MDKFTNEFFKEINKNQSIEQTLDYVFDTLDTLCLNGKFDLCDEILDKFVVENYSLNILVGVLTITSLWSNRLNNREDFYKRTIKGYDIKMFDDLE